MKYIKYLLSLYMGVLLYSCTEKLPVYSSPDNRLGFEYDKNQYGTVDDSVKRYTFVYEHESFTQDTIWVDVRTIGFLSDVERKFTIKQVPITKQDLKEYRNIEEDIQLLDAEAGKHYVPFKDTKVASYMSIAPGKNSQLFPVIINRDATLKTSKYYIKLEVENNEFFTEGYDAHKYRILEISDILTKPKYWNGTGQYYFLGKYGPKKLEFMINNSSWKINEQWFADLFANPYSVDMGYTTYLSSYYTQRLVEYNKKREELGQDVLREDPAKQEHKER